MSKLLFRLFKDNGMTVAEFKTAIPATIPIKSDIINTEEYKVIEKAAKLTSMLDFGCNIKNGTCSNGDIVCCSLCYSGVGYLKVIPESKLEMYASLFEEGSGFLGEDGCRLAPVDRSPLCGTYQCDKAKENSMTEFVSSMKNIKDNMAQCEYTLCYGGIN